MLFLALCRVFKSMEPLSFDYSAEYDVVIRSPKFTKVFVSARPGVGSETSRTAGARPSRVPHIYLFIIREPTPTTVESGRVNAKKREKE